MKFIISLTLDDPVSIGVNNNKNIGDDNIDAILFPLHSYRTVSHSQSSHVRLNSLKTIPHYATFLCIWSCVCVCVCAGNERNKREHTRLKGKTEIVSIDRIEHPGGVSPSGGGNSC